MVYAYLRVSTGHQVLENQRSEIIRFAQGHELVVDKWIEEVVSGKVKGKDRKLGRLVRQLKKGDVLIVTELSRLSRSLMDIISIVRTLLEKGVILYSTKENYSFDDSINSKVLLFAFGLVAEIERNLISIRTKEALAMREEQGVVLGHKAGVCPKIDWLRSNADEISGLIDKGVAVSKICRRYHVSRNTFKKFLTSEGL